MTTTFLMVLGIGSTLLLSIAAIVIRLVPRSSAANRFSIWQIAVISLLLLPLGIFFLPEIPLGFAFKTTAMLASSTVPMIPENSQISPLAPGETILQVEPLQVKPRRTFPATTTVNPVADPPTNLPKQADLPPGPPAIKLTHRVLAQAALAFWLTVALALLLRTLLAHLRVARHAQTIDWATSTTKADCDAWLPDSVALAYCSRLKIPITIGIWRQRIVLPLEAKNWSIDQRRMVLKHELAHVHRRDVLWQLVTSVATSIFWFQPLAWWANSQLKLERERACDDLVITGGEPADDYATVLVQLAATFSGRKTIPTGALSMAQRPIERRLATILSPSANRNSTNFLFGGLTTTIALFVVLGVCSLRPFSPVAVAATADVPSHSNFQDSETRDLDFPIQLEGLVVDEDAKPVVGAELHLTATPRPKSEAYHFDNTQATARLPIAKTDANGKYVVSLRELENGQDIWSIYGKVISENRPAAPFYKTVQKGQEPKLTIRTIAVQPGKTISGRVIPPASNANAELKNPVVTVRPIGMNPSDKWEGETVDCQSDGRFSVMVACDVRVSLQATAENFAGVGFEVPPQDRELQDVELQPGKKLKGRLLDRDGHPVAGVLVFSDTENDNRNFWNGSNLTYQYTPHFSRNCKTDENGEFELEPQQGKVRVSLRPSIYELRTRQKTVSDRIPPVMVPLQIDFEKFEGDASIVLQEAQTVQASGAVDWPDGSPAIGLEATVTLMIGSSGIRVFTTKTDHNGRYTVSIPKDTRSSISIMGARDTSNHWLFAKPFTTSDKATQQSIQILGLAPLSENASGLNWKLLKRESTTVTSTSLAEQELKDLLLAPRSPASNEIRIRLSSADNGQDKQKLAEIYQRQQQLNAAKLIAFEAKHRGEFLGAVALANIIDPKDPGQLDEFMANYLDSPNADVVLCDIYYQGNLDHTRKVLNTFATNSPHANIRATAMFHEAGVIAEALMEKEYVKNPRWHPTWPKPETPEQEIELAHYKKILDELESCDAEQMLADFDAILTNLKTNYAEHGSTVINWAGERMKERRTTGIEFFYVDQLQEHRFQLENLKSDRPLPRLTGRDVNGVDFDSDLLKGKAVLLFFTSSLYTDRENFKQLRELKTRYAGRPFEIVSVMVDSKLEDAKASVDSGKITWPTLYDQDQRLMQKWQFDPCSDRLLIDHRGVIHRRAKYGRDLDDTIERLVKKAER